MGIAILFRRDARSSPFRNAVLDLIKYRSGYGEESLIIGTGYVDSKIIYDSGHIKPELINAIRSGYKNNENIYLIAGAYDDYNEDGTEKHTPESKICKLNKPSWLGSDKYTKKCNPCEFECFANILQSQLIGNINIHTFKCHKITRNRWHAKVIMKLKNRKPYAFIIGSSNLTNVAFGENPYWKMQTLNVTLLFIQQKIKKFLILLNFQLVLSFQLDQ